MTITTTSSSSVRALLFPGADSATQVQHQLEERSALEPAVKKLGGVPTGLVGAAAGEVGSVLAGLLEIDVLDLLAAGWMKHAALVVAARQTVENPGEEQVVDLATHRVMSAHRPRIDLEVDGVAVGSLDVQIDLTFVLHAVRAVVVAGRLTALRSGLVDLTAALSCEGVPIKTATHQIDLALEADLGTGLPLLEYVLLPEAPFPGA
jgi:hypothetical protein